MKKTLFLSLLWAGMALAAHAQQRVQVGDLYYELWGNEAIVTHGNDYQNLETIAIPSTITYEGQEYAVTSIGSMAFYGCSGLTSVTIPEGVTSIGESAFDHCGSLTSITIPESVTSIWEDAFYLCSSLTSVTIPESVKRIGERAFSYCSSLTSVTIPEGVTSIGGLAFSSCDKLDTLYYNAVDCDLQGHRVSPHLTDTIYAFWNDIQIVFIGGKVKAIPAHAFEDCDSLTSVTISEGVTYIGMSAFENCSSLPSVIIPEGVTSIKSSTFRNCINLTSVTIPESVTSIEERAFYGCSSLPSVTIPESVTSIEFAFENCSSLDSLYYNAADCETNEPSWRSIRTLTIGENVKKFPSGALFNCDQLATVTILGIPEFGSKAFEDCDNLKTVYYDGDLAAWCNIPFADGKANPLCNGADLYIRDVAVTPELVIPEGFGKISDYAFYGCHLLSLTLPADLERIDGIGIIDSTELEVITCYADYPPICTEATFGGVDKGTLLYVPEAGLDDYQRYPVWRSFYNMRPFKKNGLATPALSEAITVMSGEVHLNLPGTFEAQVYDLQGRHVLSTTERHFALPQGTYIIKVGDEAMKLPVIL